MRVFVKVLACITCIVSLPQVVQAQDSKTTPDKVDLGNIGLGDIGIMGGPDGFGDFQGPGGFSGPSMDPVIPPKDAPNKSTPSCEDGKRNCKDHNSAR